MRSKKLLGLLIAFSMMFLVGCASMIGGGGLQPMPEVSTRTGDFTYVKRGVQVESSATSVFGFGTGVNNGLTGQALAELNKAHQLRPNQAFVNITVDYTITHRLILTIQRAIITADVIEFQ